MKRALIGVLAFLIILFPIRTYAEHWNELTGILDISLQFIKQEKYEKATQVLQHFSEQFLLEQNSNDTKIAPQHFRVISLAYDQAQKSLEMQDIDQRIKLDDVLALQLAVDAGVSKYQPLWIERETHIMEAFTKVEEAVQTEDNEQFQTALNTFLHEFNVIYPSLMIALPEKQLQRVNAHLSYLDEFRNLLLNNKGGQMQIGVIKEDLHKIFQVAKKDEVDSSLIWFMTITGGLILFTLTYVGWRKYKGEKAKRKSTINSKNR